MIKKNRPKADQPRAGKRILVLACYLPYPLFSGARIRSYYHAKILRKIYDLDLLCISDQVIDKNHVKELKKVFRKIFIFSFSSFHFKLNALKGLISRKPIQVHYFYFRKVQDWLDRNYQKYDLIYCNYIRTAEYAKNLHIAKVIDFHDALSKHYQDALKLKEVKGFWQIMYFLEKDRIVRYEAKILKNFDLAFINTQSDKEHILRNAKIKDKEIVVLPMAVKEELINRKLRNQEKNQLSFIGKLNYLPNEDAVLYFAKDVFPLVRKKIKNIEFYIIGANPTERILKLKKYPGIKITGFVEDPYSILEKSKLVVAPIRLGAGIQNKVLEGMVLGKTVIATPKSAAGIPEAKNNQQLIIVDPKKPQQMAKKILELLNNKKERQRIGKNARELILDHYTWAKSGNIWLENLDKF